MTCWSCRTPRRPLRADRLRRRRGSSVDSRRDVSFRIQAVTEAEVRVDEASVRQRVLELGPQLVDVDVHGAVAVAQGAAPGQAVEVLAGDDAIPALQQRDEQPQLA